MGYNYKIVTMALAASAFLIGFSPGPSNLEAKSPLTQPKVIETNDVALRVNVRYGDQGRSSRRYYHGRRGYRSYRYQPYGRYGYHRYNYPNYGHHRGTVYRYGYYPRGSGYTIYYRR